GTLNETSTQATAFTLNNTGSHTVAITNFTDANLGSLTFTGTGNSSVDNLDGITGHIVSISNTGTGTATVGAFQSDSNLNSLTLGKGVAFGSDTNAPSENNIGGDAATGTTVNAGADSAHINLGLTGANAGEADSITVGNGNDYIVDGSTAGVVAVTVGTGSNLIDLSAGSAATYAATVTLGAHTATTGIDQINVGTVQASTVAPNTVIHGAVTGDIITFADAASAVEVTAVQQTAISALANLAAAVANADALASTVAHSATSFQYGGNTYIIESVAAGNGTLAAGDSLVELVGVHTVTVNASLTSGHVVLA
ncbi:MAG: hypothetical protein ACHP7O_13445, partial [Burkholderiales bacterium]